MRTIELTRSVTESNDRDAEKIRERLRKEGVLLVNLMSSPGAGKTTFLSALISDLKDQIRIGVMEADIASTVDAETIERMGARAIQAHTDGMCHMDAGMTAAALSAIEYRDLDLVFLENIGNLICPAEYDTGAELDVMILSVPEGDDKPLKYTLMFEKSDALLLTKVDALPYFRFDTEACIRRAKLLNPDIRVFPLSAKTKEGMRDFEDWILEKVRALQTGAEKS